MLVSRQYDKLQVFFTHLVDTLHFLANSEAEPDKKFAQLLPKIAASSMVVNCKLSPTLIFQIMRCALPPIYK